MDDKAFGLHWARKALGFHSGFKYRPTDIHDPTEFLSKIKRVAIGTFAGMVATVVVHPLEYIKVRAQITPFQSISMFTIARRIRRLEGYRTFYKGISAGLFRQLSFTGGRLSAYNYGYDLYKKTYDRKPSGRDKMKIGVVAGMVGAFLGNPADVVLVRMLASSAPRAYNKCPDLQNLIENRYLGIADALNRIIMEEGIRSLWRGGVLTQTRSMIVGFTTIGAYAHIRDYLKSRRGVAEGYPLHVLATLASSFMAAVITMPIDVVKTRYQMRRWGITQKEIFYRIVEIRGPLYFWKKPFPPYFLRLTLHSLTSFFIVEHIEYFYEGEEERKKHKR